MQRKAGPEVRVNKVACSLERPQKEDTWVSTHLSHDPNWNEPSTHSHRASPALVTVPGERPGWR